MWQNEEPEWRIETKVRLQSNRYVLFLCTLFDELINRLSPSLSLSVSLTTTTEPALVHFLAAEYNVRSRVAENEKRGQCSSLDVAEATRWKRSVRTFFDSENIVGLEVSETARNACEAYQSEHTQKGPKASWRTSLRTGVKNTTISTTLFTIARSCARYNLRRDTCGLSRCEISPRKVLA